MLKCPVCNETRMREVEKDGVTIDVCPDCKGVWLDRGELEKLMAGVREMRKELDDQWSYEEETFRRPPDGYPPAPPAGPPGYGQGGQHAPYGAPGPGPYPPGPGHYPPGGGHGYGSKSKYKYDKYGRPYKKKKTVLDVFGDLFD